MSSNLGSASTSKREVVIDIEKNQRPCIYKVPGNLRKVNEVAYIPQIIAIGPYHYCETAELNKMENHKRRYMETFNERIPLDQQNELNNFIRNNEKQIRGCYSEPCEFSSEEFVEMILFDAVFIIELFLRHLHGDTSDFLLEEVWLRGIRRDLQLLENQLPYFVLEGLYQLAFLSTEVIQISYPRFLGLSVVFFQLDISLLDRDIKIKHFTDLYRQALVGTQWIPRRSRASMGALPNAVKLQKCGLMFKLCEGANLVDIRLKTSKQGMFSRITELQIPRIEIHDNTESLIRNVMTLEQCHYPSETLVCGYVMLMKFLIRTEEDVDLLVEEEIISANSQASIADIKDMFNKLCLQIPPSISYHADICQKLRYLYYRRNRAGNIIAMTLKVAAAFSFLSVIQTICSILQIVLPK